MSVFFNILDSAVIGTDPRDLVKSEYRRFFSDGEVVSKLFSEICALDMIYSIARMRDGYYRDRLVLKGGMSVRNHVPLVDHRFSFDADYDPNSYAGYSFGDVKEIRPDIVKYANIRKSSTRVGRAREVDRFHFIDFGYREALRSAGRIDIEETPKVELCKTGCRVQLEPVEDEMSTMMDLNFLGLSPLVIKHVALEEQLATKLFIVGDTRRGKRNHFDAYDALRIVDDNPDINWKKVRQVFEVLAGKKMVKGHITSPRNHIAECRHQLDVMRINTGKKAQLADVVFQKGFDFDKMADRVKELYDRV